MRKTCASCPVWQGTCPKCGMQWMVDSHDGKRKSISIAHLNLAIREVKTSGRATTSIFREDHDEGD